MLQCCGTFRRWSQSDATPQVPEHKLGASLAFATSLHSIHKIFQICSPHCSFDVPRLDIDQRVRLEHCPTLRLAGCRSIGPCEAIQGKKHLQWAGALTTVFPSGFWMFWCLCVCVSGTSGVGQVQTPKLLNTFHSLVASK